MLLVVLAIAFLVSAAIVAHMLSESASSQDFRYFAALSTADMIRRTHRNQLRAVDKAWKAL